MARFYLLTGLLGYVSINTNLCKLEPRFLYVEIVEEDVDVEKAECRTDQTKPY